MEIDDGLIFHNTRSYDIVYSVHLKQDTITQKEKGRKAVTVQLQVESQPLMIQIRYPRFTEILA